MNVIPHMVIATVVVAAGAVALVVLWLTGPRGPNGGHRVRPALPDTRRNRSHGARGPRPSARR